MFTRNGPLLAFAVFQLTLFGCLERPSQPYELDSRVTSELKVFTENGAKGDLKPLKDFTDFEWDRFHYVQDGRLYKDVNEQLGFEFFSHRYMNWYLLGGGRYMQDAPMLVFSKNGKPIHAVVGKIPQCEGAGKPDVEYLFSNTYVLLHGNGEHGPWVLKFVVKEEAADQQTANPTDK